jgi:hypothetical protein
MTDILIAGVAAMEMLVRFVLRFPKSVLMFLEPLWTPALETLGEDIGGTAGRISDMTSSSSNKTT